ncbi:MAG: hypothetical protein ACI8W9_000103 [Psychromonas sp.]|jgi:hypothetical protein
MLTKVRLLKYKGIKHNVLNNDMLPIMTKTKKFFYIQLACVLTPIHEVKINAFASPQHSVSHSYERNN